MKVLPAELPGLILIQPKVHRDERGFLLETWQEERYREAGIRARFVQDNLSSSLRGALRGLHVQLRRPQAKLIRCASGEIFDVAVDVRKGSPTFARWFGVKLSAENALQMFIPKGFAHGFAVLSRRAEVAYKCSDFYEPKDQLAILWSDPEIGIDWPVEKPLLSPKDRAAKPLKDLYDLLPSRGRLGLHRRGS